MSLFAPLPIPAPALLRLTALWFGLGLAALFWVPAGVLWPVFGGGLALLAIGDWLAARRQDGRLRVSRRLPHTLPVGSWQRVQLRLSAEAPCTGWLFDGVPGALRCTDLPLPFRLRAGEVLDTEYRLHLLERGRHLLADCLLRRASPLGLWLLPERLPLVDELHVFPDFGRLTHYALLASDQRLAQIGVQNRRRRGEGMEFHQLRDYRQEDSPRQVDWKASARMGRLISREYQDERDQRIVFLLDCGNRMHARDGELSHFDHTLNALLLLAYVALKQGDSVGLVTFGQEQPRHLPPAKSIATVNRLLHAVYDLQPGAHVPDYQQAAERFLRQVTRRSLVILVSNLRDEDDAGIVPAMRLLASRHAVTLASLREPALGEILAAPVGDFDAALQRSAALQYATARQEQATRLRHAGVQMLDVGPQELPVALINHYWARKRAGAI